VWRLATPSYSSHPRSLASISACVRLLGDLYGARQLHDQALAGFRRELGDDHPDTLFSIHNLAEVHRALGNLNRARDLHDQALAGRRRTLGDDHPDTLASMKNLAEIRGELG